MDKDSFCLTFGIELEFIACYDPAQYQDGLMAGDCKYWDTNSLYTLHHKYGILVRLDMIKTLNEKGFYTNTDLSQTDFSKWTVATDGTVQPIDDRSRNWCAIELKTPVLVFSSAAMEQVNKVVNLMVSRFKLYTNESCGLHIHVGNGTTGFTLPTLKSFCGLITAFEEQLNLLHPLSRQNAFAKPIRRAFREGASTREKLGVIAKLNHVEGIIRQFHEDNDKYMAFNFLNLNEDLPNPLRTIEFRQHRGTLDPDMIVNWASVVCVLVNQSHSNGEALGNLIEKHIDDAEYTVANLLSDLNLPDQADYYFPLVLQHLGQSPDETKWEKDFVPQPPPEPMPEYDEDIERWLSDRSRDSEFASTHDDGAAWDQSFSALPE
ncbi:hypothetical protein MMC07_003045 [Pseudocyphellaria aurata]|nr:hypothetical protein [Pseudocyphellaria aurata]